VTGACVVAQGQMYCGCLTVEIRRREEGSGLLTWNPILDAFLKTHSDTVASHVAASLR
jgi:hypothetical protein